MMWDQTAVERLLVLVILCDLCGPGCLGRPGGLGRTVSLGGLGRPGGPGFLPFVFSLSATAGCLVSGYR